MGASAVQRLGRRDSDRDQFDLATIGGTGLRNSASHLINNRYSTWQRLRDHGLRQITETDHNPYQKRKRRGLRGHAQKSIHFSRGAFKHIGAPKMERERRQLERQADAKHQSAESQHHGPIGQLAGADKISQSLRHGRQMTGSQHSRQQTDAV